MLNNHTFLAYFKSIPINRYGINWLLNELIKWMINHGLQFVSNIFNLWLSTSFPSFWIMVVKIPVNLYCFSFGIDTNGFSLELSMTCHFCFQLWDFGQWIRALFQFLFWALQQSTFSFNHCIDLPLRLSYRYTDRQASVCSCIS